MKKLVISMLLAGMVAYGSAVRAESESLIGSAVPEFELPNLEGKLFNSKDLAASQPAILFFFTSWSKSGQDEFAFLSQLYTENKSSLEVIAISFDKKLKDIKSFAAKNAPPFPILFDKKLSCLDKFQIQIIPTLVFLNREGIIDKILIDYDENVEKAIGEWLAR